MTNPHFQIANSNSPGPSECEGPWPVPNYDHNGNIVRYVSESGAVAAEYVYDPYGKVVEATGAIAEQFSFGFSTKIHDRELGLVAYQRRFLHSVIGRWLNRDPIEEEGGENLYAFCLNNPIRAFDALGKLTIIASKSEVGFSAQAIQLFFEESRSNGKFDALTESIREPYRAAIREHFWTMTFVLRTNSEYAECKDRNGNTPKMGTFQDVDVSSSIALPGGQKATMVVHHPKQWQAVAYLCVSQLCKKSSMENWLRTAIHETAHNIGWGNYYKDFEDPSFDNFDPDNRHPNQSEWGIPNGNDISPTTLSSDHPSVR